MTPYHSTEVTYDLTVDALHTYYVSAGDVPVLVHNCGSGGRLRGPDGRFTAHPDAPAPGAVHSDGMLRGTNAPGLVTSRGGFRAATEDAAWEQAEEGPAVVGCVRLRARTVPVR
ncbi:hypothetical protein [Amycolatopsis sp. NPDC021455]|uniref:hypothetical protein n=1 Tax=Amycolatopsis sp. NPDC021455 TaxID=3154901 RepID=UPI003400DC5E